LTMPHVLPRLEFEDGLPADLSTMLVMPALIASEEDVDNLLRQMEMHYLRNATPNLHFALLTDFTDAAAQHLPGDSSLVEYAVAGTATLNDKYGTATTKPFFFLHRQRLWNASEGVWMGWERKRGKLHEFNYLLRGSAVTSFTTVTGDRSVLPRIKFIITVDADTTIPRGQARRLVGTLAHPLNQAEFDPQTGQVVAGYTVLQPRTEINPLSANRSLFTRIFAGDAGLDLYTLAVSDVYQDLFGEGIYVGKGIYEVDTFERSLRGRVPENSLLSHDLFEGINGRVGLVTNVVLLEDYPPHYLVQTHRLHRWIRGDWQLLPWVLNVRRNGAPLSLIDRWKIIDNLRRSLLMPTLLALLLAGWLWLPGSTVAWTLIALALLSAPLFISLGSALFGLVRQGRHEALRPLRYDLARWFLAAAFMPYEALLALDAIVVTLVRTFITHKHLLQWVPAAHAVRMFGTELEASLTWRHMTSALIASIVIALAIKSAQPAALPVAVPLLIVWVLSPAVAFLIGRPLSYRAEILSEQQRQELRLLARRTWLFFERFVGPDDNWLPPDHFQETPRGLPAHRTSPTNIGLLLLSTLSAYDLGYIGIVGMALRIRDTFETLFKLERYRGHWLNWYDTRNLQPLVPAYVSTVDSGNLAACLLVLKQAFETLPHTPVVRWRRRDGLLDTLAMLNEAVGAIGAPELKADVAALQDFLAAVRQRILEVDTDPARWLRLCEHLSTAHWEELNQRLLQLVEFNSDLLDVDTLHNLRLCADRLQQHVEAIAREINLLAPWLALLYQPPTLFTDPATPEAIRTAWQDLQQALPSTTLLANVHAACAAGQARLQQLRQQLAEHDRLSEQVQIWCTRLDEALAEARMAAGPILIGYRNLIEQADEFFRAMDFRFLYNPQRRVFHLGYNLAADRLDNNFYDLLASEARIASLIAIAKRDVPQTHWLHLARPLTQVNGLRALLSWSGTMFEYLMPTLFMHSYDGTLLNQSERAAIDCQIAYGREKGVPWGISESAYYHFDAALNYQYRAFGVPALGFKRGLGEDLVVAPYASLLALSRRPKAVFENIQRLKQHQLLSHFGLYEAIDFTASRLPAGQDSALVRAYMAHHQGMILLALANYLGDDSMVKRFHAEPHIQSVELLLQEQIPTAAPLEFPQTEEITALRPAQPQVSVTGWQVPTDAPLPQVNVLSNGQYSVFVTSAGSGYSHWQDIDLTRWHADTTLDDWGSWLYLKDLDSNDYWSATFQPCGRRSENQEVY
ncbi:MAG TPA: glucoamylase family protein, partial [Anaerolineae bacterium]|nr:glucoamylase family protein [Anaerolineae bacterium]